MKFHIERDFNYVEFELNNVNAEDSAELKKRLQELYNLLPGKLATENRKTVSEVKAAGKPPRRDPKATPSQIRLLDQYGYDATNMTVAEASALITQVRGY